jgi:hypothetical protein
MCPARDDIIGGIAATTKVVVQTSLNERWMDCGSGAQARPRVRGGLSAVVLRGVVRFVGTFINCLDPWGNVAPWSKLGSQLVIAS